jgi:hypothetical protein
MTPKEIEIEKQLTHKCAFQRGWFARREDYRLTPEQLERGLNDEAISVRLSFICRSDFNPSPEVIEAGLTNPDSLIRHAFAEKKNYTPNKKQVKRALADISENNAVALAFVKRKDVVLGSSKINEILQSTNLYLKINLIQREDFIPTKKQFEQGIADVDQRISQVFAVRKNEWGPKMEAQFLRKKFETESSVKRRKVL